MACVLNNYHSGFRQALICKDANYRHDAEQLTVQDGKVVFISDNTSYELDEKGNCFFSSLVDGDIVSVSERGVVNQVFSVYDSDATIFMTGNCNSNCIMCPSTDHERRRNYGDRRLVLEEFIDMLPNNLRNYVVTGGEPTMKPGLFLDIMARLAYRFPDAEALLLTNGRSFSVSHFLDQLLQRCPPFLTVGIPLHASNENLHDQITRVTGSFEQTLQGIRNLLRKNVSVEIRVVVTKVNCEEVLSLCRFIASTLKDVRRVNFISLEVRGNCFTNLEEVYIDPTDSFTKSKEGIEVLVKSGIDVGLYNYPLCAIEQGFRFLCKKSISPEKVRYATICDSCMSKEFCGGLFASTLNSVHPVLMPIH